jgi:hypothetical protein
VKKCKELINNPEKCSKIGKNAPKTIKRCTLENMAKHYIKLYEKVL